MSDILEKLKSKGISESSLKLYTNNLKRLNGGNDIKTLAFLKDVDSVVSKLEHYKPNTRRSYLISVVSLLKEEPKMKKLYDRYYELMMHYNKELAVNNTKSETQEANWINQDEVLKVYEDLAAIAVPLLEKKKVTEKEYGSLLDWVVLSLYCLQPPRRNADYQLCVAVKKYDSEHADKKFNYLDTTNWKLFFNNYKTAGTYKTQIVDVNDALKSVLQAYLTKVSPLRAEFKKKPYSVPLLVDYAGKPFESNNAITRILNRIFGKRIGVSMLRNIYLTHKYGDQVEQLNDDAAAMGTSSNVIKDQYVKLS